ncbi:MAG TPA: lysoplasmalogenase [Aliiroseovarius sp.]|nr:lysoplasmalogenase [Aliiroseovarius sp.]
MDVTGIVMIIGAGLFTALAYLPMANRAPSRLRSLLKTVPLLAFALASWFAFAPPLLTAGLFLSALGDFALSRNGRAAFLYGLSAFALAHLTYILLFLGLSGLALWDAFTLAPMLAIAMIAIAISTELWLAPYTGGLRWPVRIYVLLITGMGLAVLTLPVVTKSISASGEMLIAETPAMAVQIGAGLFILSDMILALRLFRLSDTHRFHGLAGWAVWVSYIAGQTLILFSALI